MEENNLSTPIDSPSPQPDNMPPPASKEYHLKSWHIIAVSILIVCLLAGGAALLFSQKTEVTAQIRDVFIIFMALESLVLGVALVILIIQLAILINLLQNEIKPILNSTNDTVNTLRGTATFLSDNLVEPVIKLNEYLAAFKRMFDFFRPGR
jgi:hypothetical protein